METGATIQNDLCNSCFCFDVYSLSDDLISDSLTVRCSSC